MTEVQDTADQKAKRMRNIARILALVWAGLATLVGVILPPFAKSQAGWPDVMQTFYLGEWVSQRTAGFWLMWAALALMPWVGAAVAWRWEAVGGATLLSSSLLVLSGHSFQVSAQGLWPVCCVPCTVPTSFPGLVAGILFLASWRRSRMSRSPPDNRSDRE